MEKFAAIIGIVFILGLCYFFSSDKKNINRKILFWGVLLQFTIAVIIIKGDIISNSLQRMLPISDAVSDLTALALIIFIALFYKQLKEKKIFLIISLIFFGFFALHSNMILWFFDKARIIVAKIIQYTGEGTNFVFGSLGKAEGPAGFIFAVQVLSTIIFVASLFAALYYLGIMQKVVTFFAKLMLKFMGTSGAESTNVAASIFMGQTEAPLTIRHYLSKLTESELFTIMITGFAHISEGIMPAYVMVGQVDIKHLLCAVLMTAPGAILVSKMLIPETEKTETGARINVDIPKEDVNLIDALSRGTIDGGKLALNVLAMLISFIALIGLINGGFGWIYKKINLIAESGSFLAGVACAVKPFFPQKLEILFGWIFSPIAWAMGVPSQDITHVGSLMGTRMVLNEFVAYINLAGIKSVITPKSFIIATYALCGFANLGSVAIQIGGIGALIPERRHELAKLGINAMIAGSLVNFLSAAIVSLLI